MDLKVTGYSHLFNKRGGWNKRGGGAKVAKSLKNKPFKCEICKTNYPFRRDLTKPDLYCRGP